MNNGDIKKRIQATLVDMPNKNFLSATRDLFNVLGYQSERILPAQSGDVDGFITHFPSGNPNTASEQFFRDNAKSMHILFQLTSAEISVQSSLLDTDDFDTGNARSFIFAAVELNGKSYSRSQYAACTREINKRFPMPTVVLFKTAADLLTLSFVHPPRTQARSQPRCAGQRVADPGNRPRRSASRPLGHPCRIVATATVALDGYP